MNFELNSLSRIMSSGRNSSVGRKTNARDKDYVMGEAITQIQEVADHVQTLAV